MITIDLEENDDFTAQSLQRNEPNTLTFKKNLIYQVREQRCLYDNTHKLFSNVAKKELVWQQIAKKLNVNVDVCKNTWMELRFDYQRHVRCLHKYFINGHKKNRKRPAMYLEPELMFLWRFIENRKSCNLEFEIFETNTAVDIQTTPVPVPQYQEDVDAVTITDVEIIQSSPEKEQEPAPAPAPINHKTANDAQKTVDDDLILVEQPVELIVIDEDDDYNKNDKQHGMSSMIKSLIAKIKVHPELYDSENLAFKDYTRKSCIWNAIACCLGDKATKLMKIWIVMQTRYEWELWQTSSNIDPQEPPTELQVELEFLRNYILNNPDTVYKQSYYLKYAWYDPIDYFKDIFNLIMRMKKTPDIVYLTDSLLKTPEKSKEYKATWRDIAILKGCTPGQCETTWLIMRHFYWELMQMRQQSYQLTDKWYFETIISELYAISKAALKAKEVEELVASTNKILTKTSKRPSQVPPSSLGAPSATRIATSSTTATNVTPVATMPTIINNLPNVPVANLIPSTTTLVAAQTTQTFPKITGAISLAPQANQIKKIAGPPNLTSAPLQPLNNIAPSVPVPLHYNLPTQTKLTTVPIQSLIRPVVPPTTTNITTTQPFIRMQPTYSPVVRPLPPQPCITPLTTTTTPTPIINPSTNPCLSSNLTSQIVSNNSSTVLPPTQRSIASYKITTLPLSSNATTPPTVPILVPLTPTPTTTANANQLPKISGAISLLNSNEILIELIASQNGNQLLVHGPPLTAKYQLSMPMVAKLIREVLAIPLLHNKRNNQPNLINSYWGHIANKFNLPVHICRACWNFLLENFAHFPQIAPLKELMRPFQTPLPVWKESYDLFERFDNHCTSKGWLQYNKLLPEVVECISGYPVLYQDITKANNNEKLSDMEILCAWRTIRLRFPKIPEIQEIWEAIKNAFCLYMSDLEFGIENKWCINWWRSLARLKFLVEAKYSAYEPYFYIVSNKMLEEIEKCAMFDMKKMNTNVEIKNSLNFENKLLELVEPSLSESVRRKDFELSALIKAMEKYPVALHKGGADQYEAWKKIAKELHMEVTDCLLSFQNAVKTYFAYKKQDPISRCRLNEKYFKKLGEIITQITLSNKNSGSRNKLNIKTPFELNQGIDTNDSSSSTSAELVFPERYISDISMSNSVSSLVVKNWVFAIGNLGLTCNDNALTKLQQILNKYVK